MFLSPNPHSESPPPMRLVSSTDGGTCCTQRNLPPTIYCQTTDYGGDETLNSPPSSSSSQLLLHLLPHLLPPTFSFLPFLCLSLCSWSPWQRMPKCSTSNSDTVQVDKFHRPAWQIPRAACSQTDAELLNGAAVREIKARCRYKKHKVEDFIKDCCVNPRTGCPDFGG